jgi:hypothetical protein
MVMSCASTQVGRRSSSVPPALQAFFSTISVLQLDAGAVLHPLCYNSNPFRVCGTSKHTFGVGQSTPRVRLHVVATYGAPCICLDSLSDASYLRVHSLAV